MDAQSTPPEMPEFSSLTEIMERFHSVPYDQFQRDLNNWFYSNLVSNQSGSELENLESSSFGNLPVLVSEIYHRAELLTALSKAKIVTANENEQM